MNGLRSRPVWKLLALFLAANLALLGWNLARRQRQGVLKVAFLDVGQGDAAVIETPGGKVIVVDTGGIGNGPGDDAGRSVVAPFLRQEGIGHIDALILTHPHADHIGGAASLLRAFDVDMLLDNGQTDASPPFVAYVRVAQARHIAYKAARRGQRLDCGDGAIVEILSPTPEETRGLPNNASVVARLRYGRASFLLTGDAEAEEEADLIASGQTLDCDVLKAGHHGSRTSSTAPFLARAHPRYAVISVGAHNLYGHPGREVLDRFRSGQTRVFRTDQAGAVLCESDGANVRLRPMRSSDTITLSD